MDDLEVVDRALRDRYAVKRELGRGGMASVYLASDQKHDRLVAVKVLNPALSASMGTERFLREIGVTARLDHPHILPLLDSGEAGGVLYYAMPFVDGETLRDRLRREKSLPVPEALRIARQVADALSYAHARGVVHRDIKPENILLAAGHARVADFGVARALDIAVGEPLTRTGISVGTPAYMSPEQAMGADIDHRSDIYSLGCVVYEMLSGQPPLFARGSPANLHAANVSQPATSRQTERAIRRALDPDPSMRFATASDFAAALGSDHATTGWMSGRIAVAATAVLLLTAAATAWRLLDRQASPVDSVAVLPFENLSSDPQQQYFVDGMHDAVIQKLARIGTFSVISRLSMLRYRDVTRSPSDIARELNVDALVEAAVALDTSAIRITVRLIDGRSARTVWSDSYGRKRDVSGAIALQDDVASAVAASISQSLTQQGDGGASAGKSGAPSPQAYDAYLRGRYHMGQAPGGLAAAIAYFEQAVQSDTLFAQGYAALSEALSWSAHFTPVFRDRANAAAHRALQLDPNLPEAHVAIAMGRMSEWDWEGADRAFRTALRLDPSSSPAHQWYAQLLRQTLQLDEAEREAKKALELDPFSLTLRAMVGWVHFNQRRYDDAMSYWNSALELNPQFGLAIYNRGLVHLMRRDGAGAVAAARQAKTAGVPINEPVGDFMLACGLALAGHDADARSVMERIPPAFPELRALVHLYLGEQTRSLELLEEAFAMRVPGLPNLTSEPLFDELRDHARFRAIRAAMRLP